MIFKSLVVSFYHINMYDILIIQEPNGALLTIKIEEYEPERPKAPKYINDDEVIH